MLTSPIGKRAVIAFILATIFMLLGLYSHTHIFACKFIEYKLPMNDAIDSITKNGKTTTAITKNDKTTTQSPRVTCSVPKWSRQITEQPWYPLYVRYVSRVDLAETAPERRDLSCARWWHPTPKRKFTDLPDRGISWKPQLKPVNYSRPNCTFGQKMVAKTKCSKAYEQLWKRLDKIDAVYFPRDGTELGAVRQSSYISSDGDMDIVVDMPQEKLNSALKGHLKPSAHVSGKGVGRGVHWKVKGCPIVHIHFSDWMGVERGQQATHNDVCNCYMNSARMSCHKEAPSRLFTEYGPSWKVPLHAKHLDCVLDVYRYKGTVKKLKSLVGKSGLIEEEKIRGLDKSVDYTAAEMMLILAHLNIMKQHLDSGKKYTGQGC